MRTAGHLWIGLAVCFCSLGGYVLVDSANRPGRYAEEFILLGATFAALGLFAMSFAFKERLRVKALDKHMRRDSHDVER